MFGFVDISGGIFRDASRFGGDRPRGFVPASFSGRSGDGSFEGGAAGNLKLCENDPDGFRPALGRAGVLGVDGCALDCLRAGRVGIVDSLNGS